ncbi:hypothetical protein LTV02_01785 [Nocardia yamanashiensis]|uniref:hypothetical protein n=1 Tax=Nocardia yamanashiensis TaxID=209247 RepID=UPI001E506349|nr:hypothetical protein [Nocardia yamanashiensis]UGT42187.1 hypothetical protein LTV02_01785 [Nocardia yamanashiensis]
MGAIVIQLLPLAGVILGAAATFSGTALHERAKWRRGLTARWDEKRLAAYSEYANALRTYATLAVRIAAARGYPTAAQPIDIDEGLRALAEADTAKTTKWEQVLLLGSPEAVAAARNWTEAAWQLSLVARGLHADHDAYVRLFEETGRRRDRFYLCARADLAVTSGALPPGDQAWLAPPGIGGSPV